MVTRTKREVEPARLRAFELFEGLEREELEEIAETCHEYSVPSGCILIRQGQVGREVYLMEEGSVRIYREQKGETQPLATVHAPAVIGEMAIVAPERVRTASVEALGNLRLLGVPLIHFIAFLQRFPILKRSFRQLVAARTSRQ